MLLLQFVANMGFFGKRDNAPGDAIEYAPEQVDSEKQSPPEQIEQPVQTEGALIEVDPVVEKRLLRKLDLRLPTLMMFLCECCCLYATYIGRGLMTSRCIGVTGSKQYRVCYSYGINPRNDVGGH